MKEFSQEEILLLREHLQEILIDNAETGPGFTIKLIIKGGHEAVCPESFSLAEALQYSLELGAMVGLEDEQIKTSCHAIHHNRHSDIQAKRASNQLIRQGFLPADTNGRG